MEREIIAKVWPQWIVQENLGNGAFGKVYKAVHKKFDVEDYSAIKVIPVPASPGEVAAVQSEGRSESETRQYFKGIVNDFVQEIQLMLSLDGSNHIVSVKDYEVVEKEGEIGWYVLIRMELLTSYERYMQEHPMSEADVIRLGCDICSALDMCARQKVIHRDIKPANIMVHEATGNFKLGDFGVARKLENTTSGMTVAGARNYMAPEIIYEQRYNHRVDIYSLGLVLYRAMNRNRMPFVPLNGMVTHQDANEGTRRRMSGEPLPPPCDASPALAAVILKACAFKPEDRFATAAEMKQALEQAAAGNSRNTMQTEEGRFGAIAQGAGVPVWGQETQAPAEAYHRNYGMEQQMWTEHPRPERKPRGAKKWIIGAVCALCVLAGLATTLWLWQANAAGKRYLELGESYYYGDGVEQSYTEAVKWYRKAAEQGVAEAQYALGECCYYGEGTGQNYEEAAKWYRKAAVQGVADAQFALGVCYYYGEGVGQSYEEAIRWYRKAAEQSLPEAQYALGVCCYYGDGVEKNMTEAVKWYRKAAEQGVAQAQYSLGDCYYYGGGVAVNYVEAVKWYRKAATQGHADAQFALGECCYYGDGVAKDYAEAVQWYIKAAEQEHDAAQYSLGWCFYYGKGTAKDYAEAVKWYAKAAGQGYAEAQYELGNCYYDGVGVQKDFAKAADWYFQAAGQDHAEAQYELGNCYYNGRGVKQNYTEAAKWFRKAADQDDSYAQNNMGICYYYGQGVVQSYSEAVNWFYRAAVQGNATAQNNLGECYEDGEGVAKNLTEAISWYRKAAEQGHEEAIENLDRLGVAQ